MQSFNDYLTSKKITIEPGFMFNYLFQHYNTNVFPFENVEESVKWIDSLPKRIKEPLTQLGKTSTGIGEGETILKIITKSTPKPSNHTYDIHHSDGRWEIKKGTPIMSGGTHKQCLTDFITTLTLFDKIINTNAYLPAMLKFDQLNLQKAWNENFKQRSTNQVSFTNMNKTKFNNIFKENGLFDQLKNLKETNFNIKLTDDLTFIFQFVEDHNINQQYLEQSFKEFFIKDLKGLIHITEDYKYNIIYNQQFVETWVFDGITKGNRLKFKPI